MMTQTTRPRRIDDRSFSHLADGIDLATNIDVEMQFIVSEK
jgi:hypothetical protein